MMKPNEITAWSAEFRGGSEGEFQLNLWIPSAPPTRDFELKKKQREFLSMWGPPVPREAGDAALPGFEAQCQATYCSAESRLFDYGAVRSRLHIGIESTRNLVVCDGYNGCRGGRLLKRRAPTPLLPREWRLAGVVERFMRTKPIIKS
jgi:hypothetical protein